MKWLKLLLIAISAICLIMCSNSPSVITGQTKSGLNFIGLRNSFSIDTLIKTEKAFKIVSEKISPKEIRLIAETGRFYDLIVFNQNSKNWYYNPLSSSRIISHNNGEEYKFQILNDTLKISHQGEDVAYPESKLNHLPYLTYSNPDSLAPPLAPIAFKELQYNLKQDSLKSNRDNRLMELSDRLSEYCPADSISYYIQVTVNTKGKPKYLRLLLSPSSQEADTIELNKCVQDFFNIEKVDLGTSPSKWFSPIKRLYTIPIKQN